MEETKNEVTVCAEPSPMKPVHSGTESPASPAILGKDEVDQPNIVMEDPVVAVTQTIDRNSVSAELLSTTPEDSRLPAEVKVIQSPDSFDNSRMEVKDMPAIMENGTHNVMDVQSNGDSNFLSELSSSEDLSSLVLPRVHSHHHIDKEKPMKPLALPDTLEQHKPVSDSNSNVQSSDTIVVPSKIKSAGNTPRFSHAGKVGNGQTEILTPRKIVAPTKSSVQKKIANNNTGLVDTAAPFESVKDAVSKFGGIVDWKAHKTQTLERRNYIQSELSKAKEDIPLYKKQAKVAEDAKAQVLKELDSTTQLIEELKVNLEKAQMEEVQAKQDSELAKLRIEEIEQGIASEASVAAKAQLEVARGRHATAVADLKNVKDELKKLQEEYVSLVHERNVTIRNAEEATSTSKDIEKTVEDLTLELITAREALETAHTAHMEAEEQRIRVALARDQDTLKWEKELKQADDELQKLSRKASVVKDLQSKLDAASTLLVHLKNELSAYMEAKLMQESSNSLAANEKDEHEAVQKIHESMQVEVASAQKELEEVNTKIEKAREEVKFLELAAESLKLKLKTENADLAAMKQREEMASIAVSSLEAELDGTRTEIEQVLLKENEAREQMMELPKSLQEAAKDADGAKLASEAAQEELKSVKEEASQVKASASTIESRLHAALKEIEAAKASERLALAAIKALQESQQPSVVDLETPSTGVTLALDEYYTLSKNAHDAEEQANERVTAALSHIEAAKESEARSVESLELLNKELTEKREELRLATEKAEKAQEGKLGVEQELRVWRSENERRRKASDASQFAGNGSRRSVEESRESNMYMTEEEAANLARQTDSNTIGSDGGSAYTGVRPKKKKSLFPRIVMFLARKKSSSVH